MKPLLSFNISSSKTLNTKVLTRASFDKSSFDTSSFDTSKETNNIFSSASVEKSAENKEKNTFAEASYDTFLPKFSKKDFITNEKWTEDTQLKTRVYKIDRHQNLVFCDCLVLENEQNTYEKRAFPMYLFDNIDKLKEGSFVIVQIRTKTGAMRIDIRDGKGIVDASHFDLQDLWDF